MKLSFVIPTYNSVLWLPHAVESCINQTHKDIEIVIINDGSTDKTKDYLDWLLGVNEENKIVKLFVYHTEKAGRCAARNKGNSFTTGEIICVLDADDYCHPDRAKKTIEAIKKGYEFVYGSADVMDIFGQKHGLLQADVFNLHKARETLQNGIVHSTVGYTKEFAAKYPYSTDKRIAELGIDDWYQQRSAAEDGVKFDFIPSVIAAYRLTDSGISANRDAAEVEKFKRTCFQPVLIPT